MKKTINLILLTIAIICVLGYLSAELLIRGDALNKVFGIGGWLFWGGVALLVLCWGILPFFSLFFGGFPKWTEPQSIPLPSDRLAFLEKYGFFLLHQYRDDPPKEISNDIQKLNEIFKINYTDSSEYLDALLHLVPEIRQTLIENVSNRIIRDYMKKTAIWVMVSQRGLSDSIGMFAMQLRLVADLGRLYGHHLSWVFMLYYISWILFNSFLFALLDSSDLLDDSLDDIISLFAGEKLGNAIPFIGKGVGILMQGATSMAIVYATGKIVQKRLLGYTNRLSKQERFKYRLEGLKEAAKLYPSLVGENLFKSLL